VAFGPLVIALQVLVMRWQLPSLVKFLAICVVTYGLLLVSYEFAVRYTVVGTMLNGKKLRIPKLPPQAN